METIAKTMRGELKKKETAELALKNQKKKKYCLDYYELTEAE